jgi:hypothetical protein
MNSLHGKITDSDRTYADKIGRLSRENDSLVGEIRDREEKLRLSTSQTNKLMG